jgi:hypothetical protein
MLVCLLLLLGPSVVGLVLAVLLVALKPLLAP